MTLLLTKYNEWLSCNNRVYFLSFCCLKKNPQKTTKRGNVLLQASDYHFLLPFVIRRKYILKASSKAACM